MSFKKVTSIVFKTDNSSSGEITCVLEVCDKRDFSREEKIEWCEKCGFLTKTYYTLNKTRQNHRKPFCHTNFIRFKKA